MIICALLKRIFILKGILFNYFFVTRSFVFILSKLTAL